MKDYTKLEELVYANGATGFEAEIQETFKNMITPYVDKTYDDNLGNVYAELTGHPDMPRMMINAHCDSVGFMIKYIGDGGFLYTDDLPGHICTDYRMLPGTEVLINNRDTGEFINGTFVPPQPIHKLDDGDLLDSEEREDLAIDIGARTREEALKYVDVGDYVLLNPQLKITDIGNRLVGTSLDDRLGLYCLVKIAENIKKSKTKKKPTVVFVSTVCEENFIGAAAVAANNANVDISLTIDSTIATDQIVSNADYAVSKKHGWVALDEGVAIARGFGITDSIFMKLEKLCRRHKINFQIEAGGGCAENEQIQPSGKGVKTGLLSIPVRNLHTRIETASIEDTEKVITLATAYIKDFKK
jgi:putative aminopeptidase FrvX